jgi:hypothetical protein
MTGKRSNGRTRDQISMRASRLVTSRYVLEGTVKQLVVSNKHKLTYYNMTSASVGIIRSPA